MKQHQKFYPLWVKLKVIRIEKEKRIASKVFSNRYPVGTKLYEIKGESTKKKIVIQDGKEYIVADISGGYGK
ncbi:hypothetical protein [Paenibacillus sp.]|jgi:hypothetical protein|uniref:hypothetical protein n=1 Tax=Paenibacillus sp. TaxID=58172 RepID=UPI00282534CD|nr:hypothetical protein [Paenibacillus sp.]MDR0267715.1 hypothetical protein [Paenibacillus sp.]